MMGGKGSQVPTSENVALPPPLPVLVQNVSSNGQSNIIFDLKLSENACNVIEQGTREQSFNPVWHEQRKGRLTASKFYKICTRSNTLMLKPDTDPHRLVSEIMSYGPHPTTYAMKYGIAMEPHAKRKLLEILRTSHKQVSSKEVGLFVSTELPHLGASPDLIVDCKCCGKVVVEIKCPISIRDDVPRAQNLPYLEQKDEKTALKENHPYNFQVQGQMAITKINKCIFFIYTHHGYFMQDINLDNELWGQMLIKLNYFWAKYIVPEILHGSIKQNCGKIDVQPIGDLLKHPGKSTQPKKADETGECGICFEPLTDIPRSPVENSISCHSCKQWFHECCANITEIQLQTDTWICPFCSAVDFTKVQ